MIIRSSIGNYHVPDDAPASRHFHHLASLLLDADDYRRWLEECPRRGETAAEAARWIAVWRGTDKYPVSGRGLPADITFGTAGRPRIHRRGEARSIVAVSTPPKKGERKHFVTFLAWLKWKRSPPPRRPLADILLPGTVHAPSPEQVRRRQRMERSIDSVQRYVRENLEVRRGPKAVIPTQVAYREYRQWAARTTEDEPVCRLTFVMTLGDVPGIISANAVKRVDGKLTRCVVGVDFRW